MKFVSIFDTGHAHKLYDLIRANFLHEKYSSQKLNELQLFLFRNNSLKISTNEIAQNTICSSQNMNSHEFSYEFSDEYTDEFHIRANYFA